MGDVAVHERVSEQALELHAGELGVVAVLQGTDQQAMLAFVNLNELIVAAQHARPAACTRRWRQPAASLPSSPVVRPTFSRVATQTARKPRSPVMSLFTTRTGRTGSQEVLPGVDAVLVLGQLPGDAHVLLGDDLQVDDVQLGARSLIRRRE
jgi:hypothetical protein